MSVIDSCIEKAQATKKTILLPEGQDSRILDAARQIAEKDIANVIVLATDEELNNAESSQPLQHDNIQVIDHEQADNTEELAESLYERRRHKNVTMEDARASVKDRLYFGNLMVNTGNADGLVGGSIASTADMLRAAFHSIGPAPGLRIASSCFVMELQEPTPGGNDVLFFADCAVNPTPDAEELTNIALATAQSKAKIVPGEGKLAFLSFSTKGSAQHPNADKLAEAARITKGRVKDENMQLTLDGELQADAAISPKVAQKKTAESPLQGDANILIFPDLSSGNICYKMTQYLAGAKAFGPILQGLNKPVNDLSRGCSVEDIVGVSAITVCQAVE